MLIKRSDGSRVILTSRELKMLQMLADGDTARQISIKLGLSYGRVKNCKTILYTKMNAVSAVHAVVIGIREGIIE